MAVEKDQIIKAFERAEFGCESGMAGDLASAPGDDITSGGIVVTGIDCTFYHNLFKWAAKPGVVNFKNTGYIPNSMLGGFTTETQRFLDGKVEVVISMAFAAPVVIDIMGVFAGSLGVCRELNGGVGSKREIIR